MIAQQLLFLTHPVLSSKEVFLISYLIKDKHYQKNLQNKSQYIVLAQLLAKR